MVIFPLVVLTIPRWFLKLALASSCAIHETLAKMPEEEVPGNVNFYYWAELKEKNKKRKKERF